jgi:thioredoxin reductase
MNRNDQRRVVIVGAGPIGLEAALYARRLGFDVVVYERGQVGNYWRAWGHIRLFTPFEMNSTPLGRKELAGRDLPDAQEILTGHQHIESYLVPLAASATLRDCIRQETAVVMMGRTDLCKTDLPNSPKRGESRFRLLLRQGQTEFFDEADIVLDCSGTYAHHRWLGPGGLPALGELAAQQHIAYWLDDILGPKRNHYAGKSILLIGSGYSAATSACLLSTLAESHPEMWVVWLARGARHQPLVRIPNDPLRERDRLAARANNLAARGDGNVEFHSQAQVEAIEWSNQVFRVKARVSGRERIFEADRLIANVGYMPDLTLTRELQIHTCYASEGPMTLAASLLKQSTSDCLAIHAGGPSVLKTTEPNYYVLGAKSYGRNSQFLLRTGFEQIRDVFALLTGRPDLDLYKT